MKNNFLSNFSNKKLIIFLSFIYVLNMAAVVITKKDSFSPDVTTPSDPSFYYNVSHSLAEGKGYSIDNIPTYEYQPGYPFLLSAVFYFFPHNAPAAILLNILLVIASFIITMYLISEITQNKICIIFGAISFIINYQFIRSSLIVMSEPFTLFLIAILTLIVKKSYDKKDNYIYFIITGLIFGVLILTRPFFQLFPLMYSFIVLVANKYKQLVNYVLIIFLAAAVVGPYIIRNYTLFGFPQISYHFSYMLYNNSGENHDFEELKKMAGVENENPIVDINRFQKFFIKKAVDNIAANPLPFIKNYASNFLTMFGATFPSSGVLLNLISFYNLFLFLICLVFFVSRGFKFIQNFKVNRGKLNPLFLLIFLLPIYNMVIHPMTYYGPRFGSVVLPTLFIASAILLNKFLRNKKSNDEHQTIRPILR